MERRAFANTLTKFVFHKDSNCTNTDFSKVFFLLFFLQDQPLGLLRRWNSPLDRGTVRFLDNIICVEKAKKKAHKHP